MASHFDRLLAEAADKIALPSKPTDKEQKEKSFVVCYQGDMVAFSIEGSTVRLYLGNVPKKFQWPYDYCQWLGIDYFAEEVRPSWSDEDLVAKAKELVSKGSFLAMDLDWVLNDKPESALAFIILQCQEDDR